MAGRLGSLDWQPMTLTFARWLLASLVILPFAWHKTRADWPTIRTNGALLFALGAVGLGGFNMLLYLALTKTTAVNASILQAYMPAFIFILNFVVLGVRVRALQLLGLLVSMIGVLVTCTRGNPAAFFNEGFNTGDVIMLMACVVYAGYTFGLRWRPNIDWMSFMLVVFTGATIAATPFMIYELVTQPFSVPGWRGWAVLCYAVLFPTFCSQLFYAKGVAAIGGNRAGLFINLVPIFGSVLAVLILQELFQWFHAVGLLLVVGGILVAERSELILKTDKKN